MLLYVAPTAALVPAAQVPIIFPLLRATTHTGMPDNHFKGRAIGTSVVASLINLETQSLWSLVFGQLAQSGVILDDA